MVKIENNKLYLSSVLSLTSEFYIGVDVQVIVAFCVLKDSKNMTEVEAALKKKLPPFLLPDLVEISEIPTYNSGFVNENHLLRYYYNVANLSKMLQ
jgi:acyl-CoA synthetase (AMP-forming)/AMP-acid ligase II